ncbi:MAG: helix-turn-helix transcriptional regulator [Lachnospiraceae bacterium]|nr:helix-turn-helix transcriptional regulator [Lachnospiraceae bacterium]
MNVTQKIRQLAASRNWTEYRLVKESGLPASTIANIYHRNTIPSIPTLEIICSTFGITLSQFFSENDLIALSNEQEILLEQWALVSPNQRKILLDLLKSMH